MLDATAALSTRQEAFCRHFTASGNAADAARRAGYAERSARQTGCALLERPYIVERVRRIRMSWQRTARDEARIALTRLEQAWDAAVASGSAYLMLQIVRLQAEIAGLARPAGMRRAVLWPVAGEDEFGEMAAGDAPEAGTEPGPLADALRRGRDRAERVLARHSANREVLERQEDFDGAAHAQTAERLADAIEERERLPVGFEPPAPPPAEDRPQADDPPEETYEEDGWVGGRAAQRRRQGRWRRKRLALPAPQRFRRTLRSLDAGEHRAAKTERPRMGWGAPGQRPPRPRRTGDAGLAGVAGRRGIRAPP